MQPSALTRATRFSNDSQFFLNAERKRRKRKESAGSPSPSYDTDYDSGSAEELPDFDLLEDDVIPEDTSVSTSNFDINDPSIQDAMRARSQSNISQGMSVSAKDLLKSRNRELEQKLVMNDIKEDVPSLAEYTRNKMSSGSGIGKKALRREERVAAAIDAKQLESKAGSSNILGFLGGLGLKDKDGNPKTAVKLLEEGTWACIWMLIAWEVFINSPLFQRQGSMPPIVFREVTELFLM